MDRDARTRAITEAEGEAVDNFATTIHGTQYRN
jgi:hypothetical protein